MNLMPFLAFQILYSETPKMFLRMFLADWTNLRTFLIVIIVSTVPPAMISQKICLFEIVCTVRAGNGNVESR